MLTDLLTLLKARLAAIPPNRLVVYATPVLTAAAGYVAALAARYLPGIPNLDSSHILAVFLGGALIAAGMIHKWLTGWQAHEALLSKAKLDHAGPLADPEVVLNTPADIHPDDAIPAIDDLTSEKAKAAEKARVRSHEKK